MNVQYRSKKIKPLGMLNSRTPFLVEGETEVYFKLDRHIVGHSLKIVSVDEELDEDNDCWKEVYKPFPHDCELVLNLEKSFLWAMSKDTMVHPLEDAKFIWGDLEDA